MLANIMKKKEIRAFFMVPRYLKCKLLIITETKTKSGGGSKKWRRAARTHLGAA
jgi:hypothetical protein